MGLKTIIDIQSVYKNKIIPLLEEYFYGKPQMVGLVLGPSFIKKKEAVIFFNDFDTEYSDLSEKKRYEIIIPDNWQGYRNIYASN